MIHPRSVPPENAFARASARFPGDHYQQLLERMQQWLRPAAYLEIGVDTGRTLALCRRPTVAVGIDPSPSISVEFDARTTIHTCTSDDYFRSGHSGSLAPDLVFIDGMHLFEYALRDLINVEKIAHPNTVVLVHDCLPLDTLTAERRRQTGFWTGDVWKLVPCLAKYRADLRWRLIPTAPTGLLMITGLDPGSCALADNYESICRDFEPLRFEPQTAYSSMPSRWIRNDWDTIKARLQAWGVCPCASDPGICLN